jgi:hypothetical protein
LRSVLCSKIRGALVSWFVFKTKVDGFSLFDLKTDGYWFSSMGLKTDSYGLVIWASKSPQRFFGLGLKTKWATVCRLHHKTNRRMKTVWDAHQDLAACFAWKLVGLGFPSLASRLVEAQHESCIKLKLKMNGSMRWAASDPSTPTLPFLLY